MVLDPQGEIVSNSASEQQVILMEKVICPECKKDMMGKKVRWTFLFLWCPFCGALLTVEEVFPGIMERWDNRENNRKRIEEIDMKNLPRRLPRRAMILLTSFGS